MRLAGFDVGSQTPLFLIAGPCVIESEALGLSTAERLKDIDTLVKARPFLETEFHQVH